MKLVFKLRALSVDLRPMAAVVLSSPTGGVPGGLREAPPSLSRGVCGRDAGAVSEASWDSKSARISLSPMALDEGLAGLTDLILADFLGLASSPMPWKSSSRLSSAASGLVFLEAMAGNRGEGKGRSAMWYVSRWFRGRGVCVCVCTCVCVWYLCLISVSGAFCVRLFVNVEEEEEELLLSGVPTLDQLVVSLLLQAKPSCVWGCAGLGAPPPPWKMIGRGEIYIVMYVTDIRRACHLFRRAVGAGWLAAGSWQPTPSWLTVCPSHDTCRSGTPQHAAQHVFPPLRHVVCMQREDNAH